MKEHPEDPKFDAALTKAVKTPFTNASKKKKEMAKKISSFNKAMNKPGALRKSFRD